MPGESPDREPGGGDQLARKGDGPRRAARGLEKLRSANRRPGVVSALRSARELLPGDDRFGDELSTGGELPSQVVARFLAERGGKSETATREAGLAALQVWQALSERVGRGAGASSATILFTDLVGFSAWVLSVGDEKALELLRGVAGVVEPAISRRRGRLVKRLGDGHMAVFPDPRAGVDAALDIQEELVSVQVDDHRPRMRAGLHVGNPRQLGGDYLGADVNIAARIGAAAGAGEVLVSDAVLRAIDPADLEIKRRRGFRAKGTPRELEVFRVARQ